MTGTIRLVWSLYISSAGRLFAASRATSPSSQPPLCARGHLDAGRSRITLESESPVFAGVSTSLTIFAGCRPFTAEVFRGWRSSHNTLGFCKHFHIHGAPTIFWALPDNVYARIIPLRNRKTLDELECIRFFPRDYRRARLAMESGKSLFRQEVCRCGMLNRIRLCSDCPRRRFPRRQRSSRCRWCCSHSTRHSHL